MCHATLIYTGIIVLLRNIDFLENPQLSDARAEGMLSPMRDRKRILYTSAIAPGSLEMSRWQGETWDGHQKKAHFALRHSFFASPALVVSRLRFLPIIGHFLYRPLGSAIPTLVDFRRMLNLALLTHAMFSLEMHSPQ